MAALQSSKDGEGPDVVLHKQPKVTGRAFYERIGSPKVVLAPMVNQSEFAWRVLTRSFMATGATSQLLAYSPMFHARLFTENHHYREKFFQPTRPSLFKDTPVPTNQQEYLDGRRDIDRPLTVQFCANDPDHFLNAAKYVEEHCDAVDLNLGCPQGIARSGKYGAFLQEDQDLIYRLINKLHNELAIPVTAKIRILETKEDTLAYAKNVLSAGASILTVHGRRREQKGHITGLADWSVIRYLRENLPSETVLFANGNILRHEDIAKCLEVTGADAVMSAEGNLHDPTIFAPRPSNVHATDEEYWCSSITKKGGYRVDYVFRRYLAIIYKYVLEEPEPERGPLFNPANPTSNKPEIPNPFAEPDGPPRKKSKKGKKKSLQSPSLAAMQAHLFSMLRPLVSANTEVRDALAKSHGGDMAAFEYVLALTEQAVRRGLEDYADNPGKYEDLDISSEYADDRVEEDIMDSESSAKAVRACKKPWWVCQAYVRPVTKEAIEKGSIQLSKKEKSQSLNLSKSSNATATPQLNCNPEDVSATEQESSNPEGATTARARSKSPNEDAESLQLQTDLPPATTICG